MIFKSLVLIGIINNNQKMANRKIHNKDDESYRVYYESTSSSDSIYSIISFQKRIRLIEMVLVEKKTIIDSAAKLEIKLSTARHILKLFRKEGKVVTKKGEKSEENQKWQSQIEEMRTKIEKANKKIKGPNSTSNENSNIQMRQRYISDWNEIGQQYSYCLLYNPAYLNYLPIIPNIFT